ncbi:MAG: hypothetical protein RQ731_08435 [Anaerosomatales bacterium]|nr:hypothetical protein [Anaerosomatales bacterium]
MVAYRYLTDSDFFNIYKPTGTEEGGGGQTYIDFPTSNVSIEQWDEFFRGVIGLETGAMTVGPFWSVPIHSLGVADPEPPQNLRLYQRRKPTVSVAAQNINTRAGDRLNAWDSSEGFPEPIDPASRHEQRPDGLCVFLVRTEDREVWAGWFMLGGGFPTPGSDTGSRGILAAMLDATNLDVDGAAGLIDTRGTSLLVEETRRERPFYTEAGVAPQVPLPPRQSAPRLKPVRYEPTEEEILDRLFSDDTSADAGRATEQQKAYYTQVRHRDAKAVQALKRLYGFTCQITAATYTFDKADGERYVEVHHLVPLGSGGADDPRNMIVVSALVHRMLHYAVIEPDPIDLSRIELGSDGWGALEIKINGKPHWIHYHPEHAAAVLDAEGA